MLGLIFIKNELLNIQELLLRRLRHVAKTNLDLALCSRTDLTVLLCDVLPASERILLTEKLQGISHLGREHTVDDGVSLLQ